jgi:glucuronosyltransferase
VTLIDGFKVLGILPFGSTSHFAIGHGIIKSLHKAGHEVTVISPYPQKKPLDNYRDISIKEVLDAHAEGVSISLI